MNASLRSFGLPSREEMQAQMEAARRHREAIEVDYAARAVAPEAFSTGVAGPVHAASILVWNRVAELAGVAHIPAEVVASIPMAVVFQLLDGEEPAAEHHPAIRAAGAYCRAGGFWRTELCAGEEVKWAMSQGRPLPPQIPFSFEDCRIMDLHWGMPDIKVIGRPRLTPVRVNGYPVEFRVFHGGEAADGAVSWYYPQAGHFEVTEALARAMEEARHLGGLLHAKRAELQLTPWIPGFPESATIGSTIDFMLTEKRGLVMVDAGPGYGHGAHPCCFIDSEVAGERWTLAEGVELR